jgi:PAS domain S-box-containing protein
MDDHQAPSQKCSELRRQAEALLKAESVSPGELSPQEAARLIHELQVHQVELAIQNEELRHTQMELIEAARKYTELYDFAPAGHLTVNKLGEILEANLSAMTILGMGRGQLLGHYFPVLFMQREDRKKFRRILMNEANREEWQGEIPIRDGKGVSRTLLVNILFAQGPAGQKSRRLALLDITSRKQAEEQIRETAVELRAAVAQLQAEISRRRQAEARIAADLAALNHLCEISMQLIEHNDLRTLLEKIVAAAIAITGADKGNIQLFDPASGTLKIFASQEFDQPFLDFFDTVPEDIGICGTAMRRRGRLVIEDVRQSPILAGTPAQEILLAAGVGAVQSTPIISRAGTFLGMISTHWQQPQRFDEHGLRMVDLLARQAAELIERTRAEAEQLKLSKLESLGILAAGIAHDFNNILTAIMGNISLAQSDYGDSLKYKELLTAAEKACLQAQTLSWQLLTFAKGGTPVKEPLALGALAAEAASFACQGSNVKCEFDFPENLWGVNADRGQLSQVFQNLVINAVQAMPQGGAIRFRGGNLILRNPSELHLEPGRYVKIDVQDQGIGIPAAYLQNIFDPYFTTKQQGSGLGLAVAYSIIKSHQGHITVESAPGQGTTFHIYLPGRDLESLRPAQEELEPLTGTGKILVMDDDVMVREVLGRMLASLGYEVEYAQDGAETLVLYDRALATKDLFAGVILDLTVQNGMGGKETVERLLKIDPQVKAFVTSGYSDDPVMSEYQKHGFAGVLVKPYKISELGRVLKQSLAGAE